MYKKIIHIIGFLLFFSFILNSNAEESITVSTYYPSPSGVYKTLRLIPRSLPPASGKPGELCFLDGTDPAYAKGLYAYIDDFDKWQPAAGSEDLEQKLPLVNAMHTGEDCINAGGQIVDTEGSFKQCRFDTPSCPGGWTHYQYWSSCDSTTCYCYNGSAVSTGKKPWQNKSFDAGYYKHFCGGTQDCPISVYQNPINSNNCCRGQIIQIGCY